DGARAGGRQGGGASSSRPAADVLTSGAWYLRGAGAAPAGGSKRGGLMSPLILLVEDAAALRAALGETLRLGGYAVCPRATAGQALAELTRQSFSLVLSDVNMPGMDGHQLLQQIRQQQPWLPVLLTTAYASVERAVSAMREGAQDYLVKPFEPRQLLQEVARHARGQLQEDDGPVAVEASSRQLLELAARVAR